ncbi:hypothetical protein BS78_06G215700, partial [Paspalum vaginatum]
LISQISSHHVHQRRAEEASGEEVWTIQGNARGHCGQEARRSRQGAAGWHFIRDGGAGLGGGGGEGEIRGRARAPRATRRRGEWTARRTRPAVTDSASGRAGAPVPWRRKRRAAGQGQARGAETATARRQGARRGTKGQHGSSLANRRHGAGRRRRPRNGSGARGAGRREGREGLPRLRSVARADGPGSDVAARDTCIYVFMDWFIC